MTESTAALLERIAESGESSRSLYRNAIIHQLAKPGLPDEDLERLTEELQRIGNPVPFGCINLDSH